MRFYTTTKEWAHSYSTVQFVCLRSHHHRKKRRKKKIVIKCKTWKMLRNEWNGTKIKRQRRNDINKVCVCAFCNTLHQSKWAANKSMNLCCCNRCTLYPILLSCVFFSFFFFLSSSCSLFSTPPPSCSLFIAKTKRFLVFVCLNVRFFFYHSVFFFAIVSMLLQKLCSFEWPRGFYHCIAGMLHIFFLTRVSIEPNVQSKFFCFTLFNRKFELKTFSNLV